MNRGWEDTKCMLVVAHPGHELFVAGWMLRTRPVLQVLTTGEGRLSSKRIDYTRSLAESAGIAPGELFGRFQDQQFYEGLLQGEVDLFLELAQNLHQQLIDLEVDRIVGDSYERQFLSHDLCRLMVSAAVKKAEQKDREIEVWDFPMYGYYAGDEPRPLENIEVALSEDEFQWKMQAARNFPDPQIQAEVDQLLQTRGEDRFRRETLRRITSEAGFCDQDVCPPRYELDGQKLVAAGEYEQAIGYVDHVLPLARQLLAWAEGSL